MKVNTPSSTKYMQNMDCWRKTERNRNGKEKRKAKNAYCSVTVSCPVSYDSDSKYLMYVLCSTSLSASLY